MKYSSTLVADFGMYYTSALLRIRRTTAVNNSQQQFLAFNSISNDANTNKNIVILRNITKDLPPHAFTDTLQSSLNHILWLRFGWLPRNKCAFPHDNGNPF